MHKLISGNRSKIMLRKDKFRSPKGALFLDRDGVIISDKHHICKPEEVELCEGIEELLEKTLEESVPVVVVTNQSGITRGYFDWNDYINITKTMLYLLEKKAKTIVAIYANGYGPNSGFQSWRKPNSGMIDQAIFDYNIDPNRSVMIGDKMTDMKAAIGARIRKMILVSSSSDEITKAKYQCSRQDHKIELHSSLKDVDKDRLVSYLSGLI